MDDKVIVGLTSHHLKTIENIIFKQGDHHLVCWQKNGLFLRPLLSWSENYPVALCELRFATKKALSTFKDFEPLFVQTLDLNLLQKLYWLIYHWHHISSLLSFWDMANGFPSSIPISKSAIECRAFKQMGDLLSAHINKLMEAELLCEFNKEFLG